jgi:hypothetical protein
VCEDLRGLVKNPDLPSCWCGFLRSFREQVRGFHDLLKQKPSSLFILLGWSSISVTSLMMRSMCLSLVKAICSSKTSVKTRRTTRRHIPADDTSIENSFQQFLHCFITYLLSQKRVYRAFASQRIRYYYVFTHPPLPCNGSGIYYMFTQPLCSNGCIFQSSCHNILFIA